MPFPFSDRHIGPKNLEIIETYALVRKKTGLIIMILAGTIDIQIYKPH